MPHIPRRGARATHVTSSSWTATAFNGKRDLTTGTSFEELS
jgi:hypothetical protein